MSILREESILYYADELLENKATCNDVFLLNMDAEKAGPEMLTLEGEYYASLALGTGQIQTNSINEKILRAANARYNSKIINNSYQGDSNWTFSPCKGHKGFYTLDEIKEKGKDRSPKNQFRNTYYNIKNYSYYKNVLRIDIEKQWPVGEGVIYLYGGKMNKCNIFVFDTLTMAGLCPPLNSRHHYYGASINEFKQLCSLQYFEKVIKPRQVQPGDIFQSGGGGHVAIVNTLLGNNKIEIIEWWNWNMPKYSGLRMIKENISTNNFYRVTDNYSSFCPST